MLSENTMTMLLALKPQGIAELHTEFFSVENGCPCSGTCAGECYGCARASGD